MTVYFFIFRPMRRPLSKQLTMVLIFLKWIISGAIFAAELYKFRLFKDSGQVECAPRWVENNRHDRPRLPCSRWSVGSHVVILGSAANYGHVLFRNCAAFVEKEGVWSAHRKKTKAYQEAETLGGHNACHHSDTFCHLLASSARQ